MGGGVSALGTQPTSEQRVGKQRLGEHRLATVVLATVVLATMALATSACRGPQLTVESEGPVYVDGVRADAGVPRPFGYYGTTSIDALPDDAERRPDWSKKPSRTLVTNERPVSAWLFPLDLPIELLLRPFSGPEDRTVTVAPAATESQVTVGFQPEGLEPLRTRAFAARAAR